MKTKLLPDGFLPPQSALVGSYSAHPITTSNVMEDWLVISSNADAITRQRGEGTREGWPHHCSLEENYKDLAWLELCGVNGQLFAYILRKPGDDSYAGCAYIYPIEFQFAYLSDQYSVDFSFWITQAEEDAGKYEATYKSLLAWLEQAWPFEPASIRVRNPPRLAAPEH